MSEPIVEAKEDVKREYLRRATVIRTIHNELQNWQAVRARLHVFSIK